MIELGHLAVVIAVSMALVQASLPIICNYILKNNDAGLREFSSALALMQACLLGFGFVMLMVSFLRSDFSVLLIYQHSHTLKPILYKVTSLWGNHEGSLLLWLLVMGIFNGLLALLMKQTDVQLKFYALSVQGGSIFLFGLFMLLTSNPFVRLLPMPTQGQGFNPILQDPGLAFHPPTLYMGYVGLSTVFSLAVAGLLNGKIDKYWAQITHIFAMLAWLFLTAGIALGSFWAYYELGWGGFWFWDPVENSSLMPWLLCTALIHSLSVLKKTESLKHWTIFLSLMSFGLSLIGTFLVRSGIITSVHSFANDPERGLFILLIIGIMLAGSFLLYAFRGSAMQEQQKFSPLSREGLLIFNNVFLLAMAGTVFLGTFYPLAVELANNARISVGAPFYNLTFVPLMAVCMILIGFVPMIGWRFTSINIIKKRLRYLLPIVLGLSLGILWLLGIWQTPTILVLLFGLWVMISALNDLRKHYQKLLSWSMNLAHIGLGIMAIGATIASTTSVEKNIITALNQSFEFQQYTLTPRAFDTDIADNYQTQKLTLEVKDAKGRIFNLYPEKRFYPVQQQETTEAAIRSFWGHDLYIALGDINSEIKGEVNVDTSFVIRAYYKNMVSFIWLGACLMVFASALALVRHFTVKGR